MPADRIRLHLRWGNYDGPHTHDVPLKPLLPLVTGQRARSRGPAAAWRQWARLPAQALDVGENSGGMVVGLGCGRTTNPAGARWPSPTGPIDRPFGDHLERGGDGRHALALPEAANDLGSTPPHRARILMDV